MQPLGSAWILQTATLTQQPSKSISKYKQKTTVSCYCYSPAPVPCLCGFPSRLTLPVTSPRWVLWCTPICLQFDKVERVMNRIEADRCTLSYLPLITSVPSPISVNYSHVWSAFVPYNSTLQLYRVAFFIYIYTYFLSYKFIIRNYPFWMNSLAYVVGILILLLLLFLPCSVSNTAKKWSCCSKLFFVSYQCSPSLYFFFFNLPVFFWSHSSVSS